MNFRDRSKEVFEQKLFCYFYFNSNKLPQISKNTNLKNQMTTFAANVTDWARFQICSLENLVWLRHILC